jgi:surface polysaccharide O-acyltransferase-like enzyme
MDNNKSIIKKKKRIFYIDLLRGLCIIGVIMTHIPYGSFVNMNGYNNLFYTSLRFALPVFLMISGTLLLNKNYSINYFLKRRGVRIIYPLIFWTTIAIITHQFYNNYPITNYTNNFIINHVINYFYSYLSMYWYMWIILGTYLSWPVLNSFIKDKKIEGVKYFLYVWVFSLIVWHLYMILNKPLIYLDLSLFLGPLGFLVLGYYLHNKKFKYSKYKIMLIGFTIYMIAEIVELIFLNYGWFNFETFQYYIFLIQTGLKMDLFTIIESIGVFIFIKNLMNLEKVETFLNKSNVLKRIIMSLSRSTYGIYFSHFIVLDLLGMFFYPILPNHPYINIIWLIFLTLISSWALILVLSKIPIIKKFSGYY